MTLLVRDEADIVEAQIAFHLHAGVDFVIATDNGSRDGTTEILERYERAGYLHLIRDDGRDMQQDVWVTRMARLAATDFGADWVINSDADEFWWPRGESLKSVLDTVPSRYGVVRGCWRHFLPGYDDGSPFYERMTVRLAEPALPSDKSTIFHSHQKVAHRARRDVSVATGNHDATGSGLEPLRAWHPIEVLHFSFRSLAHFERKSRRDWDVWSKNRTLGPTLHHARAYEAARHGNAEEYFRQFVAEGPTLEHGLADGRLAIDTRLRDALRHLRVEDGFAMPGEGRELAFPRPDVREDALYAGEASVLVEIDGIVRAESRIDSLEQRLAALERTPTRGLRGVGARLRRLARP